VILDFKGVRGIGPAFADEVFRVFRLEHPNVHLIPVHTDEEVQKMIRRAEAARRCEAVPQPMDKSSTADSCFTEPWLAAA
jgi:hypothetical protein